MKKENKYLGYFQGGDDAPTVDPTLDVECFVCMEPLREKPRKTISFVTAKGGDRSYFFRVHKDCWNGLTSEEENMYESSFVDNLDHGGDWIPPTLHKIQ